MAKDHDKQTLTLTIQTGRGSDTQEFDKTAKVEDVISWAIERFGLGSDDRFTSHAPFHFDLSTLDLFASLRVGASVFLIDRTANFRGVPPRVPAIGSAALLPSGPAQAIVFAGDPSNFVGNDLLDVRLDCVERWRYLRT